MLDRIKFAFKQLDINLTNLFQNPGLMTRVAMQEEAYLDVILFYEESEDEITAGYYTVPFPETALPAWEESDEGEEALINMLTETIMSLLDEEE